MLESGSFIPLLLSVRSGSTNSACAFTWCVCSGMAARHAYTRPAALLLEQLAACVEKSESVLLVGETGTGKTSTVQHLAALTGE